jgi:hypothetical protein
MSLLTTIVSIQIVNYLRPMWESLFSTGFTIACGINKWNDYVSGMLLTRPLKESCNDALRDYPGLYYLTGDECK